MSGSDSALESEVKSSGLPPRIRLVALIAGPSLGWCVSQMILNWGGADPPAAQMAGVAIWMAIWWITEAIPLAGTALIPIVALPMIDVSSVAPRMGERIVVEVVDGEGQQSLREARWAGWADAPATTEGVGAEAAREPRVQVRWSEVSEGGEETAVVSRAAVRSWGEPVSALVRTLSPYADKFIFLFLGGFLIARGIERWGLHRRVALVVMSLVGTSPRRLVAGAMLVTAGMSMWLSNTATTLVMLPVAVSLADSLAAARRRNGGAGEGESKAFRTAILLGIAYAATIGGMATPIGTPTNALLMRELEKIGESISFAAWTAFATPMAMVMLVGAWLLLIRVDAGLSSQELPDASEALRRDRESLGAMSRGEKASAGVFMAVAGGWILRDPLMALLRLPDLPALEMTAAFLGLWDDATIAVAGGIAMFAIPVGLKPWRPVLEWDEAKTLPWDVLLLFGGGLSLSEGIRASGLDAWMGEQLGGLEGVPPWVMVLSVVLIITFLTEMTSNMATAALFLPIVATLGARWVEQGVTPALLMVPVALAASCAFMLPVATPPNALVFGGGGVAIRDMVRIGIWMNLGTAVWITIWVSLVGRWVCGW